MSVSFQKVTEHGLKNILSTRTSNHFKGIFTGILFPAITQLSSATTVMLVSFVNAA